MKSVDTLWNKTYKAPLYLFGIPLLVIGVVFMMLDGSWGFLINGALWSLIGLGVKTKSNYDKRKLESFKKEGRCHEGTVVRVLPVHWIRAGNYVTVRVECVYKTSDGEKEVKSGYYLLSPFDQVERLTVKVYSSLKDAEDYVVELMRLA